MKLIQYVTRIVVVVGGVIIALKGMRVNALTNTATVDIYSNASGETCDPVVQVMRQKWGWSPGSAPVPEHTSSTIPYRHSGPRQ